VDAARGIAELLGIGGAFAVRIKAICAAIIGDNLGFRHGEELGVLSLDTTKRSYWDRVES